MYLSQPPGHGHGVDVQGVLWETRSLQPLRRLQIDPEVRALHIVADDDQSAPAILRGSIQEGGRATHCNPAECRRVSWSLPLLI